MKRKPVKDITLEVVKYRECALEIWNKHLVNPPCEYRFDAHDRWADACVHLFRALVLYPFGYEDERLSPDYRAECKEKAYIHVVPTSRSEIRIEDRLESGIWGLPAYVEEGEVDLRFIAFFDWSVLSERSFEFVKVLIRESSKCPEFKGKQALIKADGLRFMLDEDEISEEA